MKTISVRYLDIDVGLIFQRHWDFLCFDERCIRRVLKTISVRYLDIEVGLIYFKGTGIFLLTDEDDFRSILGYRCGPYISKALRFSY